MASERMPAAERVSLAACSGYTLEEVEAALRRVLEPLGGLSAIVRPGQRVVLKPNLLRPAAPESATTTHPALVAATARLVREAGAEPFILDSSGGPNSAAYLAAVYRATGMVWAAEAGGATLVTQLHAVQVPVQGGLILHRVDLVREAIEADVLVNLPKLKTHGLTGLSVAVKNLFGLVPGTTKVGYHARLRDPADFARGLLDIGTAAGAALHIVDAVVGMEGNGPSAGDPRAVGALVAGSDALVVDTASAALVGRDPLEVRPIRVAAEEGRTTGRVADLELLGDPLAALAVEPFRLPDAYRPDGARHLTAFGRLASGGLARRALVTLRATSRCTGCGMCARHCPVEAITLRDGHAELHMDRCIRCYCCHELCPALAVEVHRPLLGRLFGVS